MRTTLNIEDDLIRKVSKFTGIKEKTTLVRLGLEALIARESSKRLSKLGGTEKITRYTTQETQLMILVDTSIWVSYLRAGNSKLEQLLNDGEVTCHPFIIGELACGNIKNRAEILSLLNALPKS